jgi:hypothetical protein
VLTKVSEQSTKDAKVDLILLSLSNNGASVYQHVVDQVAILRRTVSVEFLGKLLS